jgi:hypothetical protein
MRELNMNGMERIRAGEKLLAIIISAGAEFPTTTFFTPADFLQQGGFVVYPAGGKVAAHGHTLVERHLIGTAETVMVRRGKAILKLFDNAHQVVAERMMTAGDIVMLVSGGHGFTMLEDTILFEIKQGPYTGLEEKERFE